MARIDDMKDVLKKYDLIHIMYNRLIELEKENKKNSKEAKMIWDLIDDFRLETIQLLSKYPLNDQFIDDFINNMFELGNPLPENTEYLVCYSKGNKLLRLCRTLALLMKDYHIRVEEDYIPSMMVIGDTAMSGEEGLEYLEQNMAPEEFERAKNDIVYSSVQRKAVEQGLMLSDDYQKLVCDLEAHIFMAYLEEAIEKNKDNITVRDALIEAKYALIYNIKTLEETYIMGIKPESLVPEFYQRLVDIFDADSIYYTDFVRYEENKVSNESEGLIERNKEKYEDMDDFITDILRHISLRTALTCIPSDAVRDESLQEIQVAAELAQSPIDKKLLENSKKVNKKFVFNQ